ncbi:MAG: methylmalonyl Co-A mutase-associated GTPase MeaB [Bacteroidetes bacterium]|nr:methylmalonyl Co-A mutase-associated GTPase MeaB [Bacteroidota bacterium]
MNKKQDFKSALNVMDGIEQPGQINADAVKKLKSKRPQALSTNEFVHDIRSGNRTILSKAITLIESSLHSHQHKAQEIINSCLPFSGKSIRIGITGVPGVGKSTFIEALGMYLTTQGHKVAVLAIDPSSTRSKGSILGDKTRMEELAVNPLAYIRPSPSAGSLGGVARKTRETIILCEAAGFDVILVETVGVGQSETTVRSMVDFFLLLMLAGAGDELQGIKRGIMEMADAIFINKADGDNVNKAKAARIEYKNALHLFPPAESGWNPVVDLCSAQSRMGIETVWTYIGNFTETTKSNGFFEQQRKQQFRQVLTETIDQALKRDYYGRKDIAQSLAHYEKEVLAGNLSPYTAASMLLEKHKP